MSYDLTTLGIIIAMVAQVLAILRHHSRTEHRLTRIETQLELLLAARGLHTRSGDYARTDPHD